MLLFVLKVQPQNTITNFNLNPVNETIPLHIETIVKGQNQLHGVYLFRINKVKLSMSVLLNDCTNSFFSCKF